MRQILNYLTWLSFVFFQSELCYANTFSIEDIDSVSYVQRYNALPSAEEADAALRKSPCFETLLQEVREITSRYRLDNSIGLRLIHQHFSLNAGQIVLERFESVEGTPSLVSYAHTWEDARRNEAMPSSWIFSDRGESYVFETSVDPAVKRSLKIIEQHPSFLEEVRSVLWNYKLNDLLALAILERTTLVAAENQIFFEDKTSDQKNIVQVWDREAPQIGNAINSAWSFTGSKEEKFIRVQAGCAGSNDKITHESASKK